MEQHTEYVYDLRFYDSDRKNNHGVKGATKIIAQQISNGNRSEIKVKFIGNLEIKVGQDNPEEIGSSIPTSQGEEQMPEIQPEQNDELLNDLEKLEEEQGETGQEKQDEIQEELQPEPKK